MLTPMQTNTLLTITLYQIGHGVVEDTFILRKTQFYKTLEIFYNDPGQLVYLMM
jgi:hypothetical protein